jgi:hypothetical protein
MTQVALKGKEELARPLKVLVPLIKEEIELGWEAGVDHYCKAGELLLEARAHLGKGEWSGWLDRNFHLSATTAWRYMQLAEVAEKQNGRSRANAFTAKSMSEVIDSDRAPGHRVSWHEPVKEILTERVTPNFVDRFAQERQDKEKELQLMRKLANELIDIGYKVLATRLHPDKGGSQEAMSRLNKVKSLLKQAI